MKRRWTAACAALGMTMLILDSKTALIGAQVGISVCLQTVIPSLFPFLVLSSLLNSALMGCRIRQLEPMAAVLRVPKNAIALIIVGLLGGYPVGAKVVGQACQDGDLAPLDGKRMLAFCSNAGPAFLFGMGAALFPKLWFCFLAWGIHILSAWIVALLTPRHTSQHAAITTRRVMSLPQAVATAMRTMASVCGWVVLMRIVVSIADRWVLWACSREIRTFIIGTVELANGCCALTEIGNPGLRLCLFVTMLSFGGLCVAMQTASVLQGVSMSLYLPGKCCQAAVSFLLSIPCQFLLEQDDRWLPRPVHIVLCTTICAAYSVYAEINKKSSSISAAAVV